MYSVSSNSSNFIQYGFNQRICERIGVVDIDYPTTATDWLINLSGLKQNAFFAHPKTKCGWPPLIGAHNDKRVDVVRLWLLVPLYTKTPMKKKSNKFYGHKSKTVRFSIHKMFGFYTQLNSLTNERRIAKKDCGKSKLAQD